MGDDVATDRPNRVEVEESVWIVSALPGGVVHEGADGEVGQHQAPELLADEFGSFAAEDDPGAAEVGLEFVQRGFDLPALAVESGQLRGRGRGRSASSTVVNSRYSGSASATPAS